MSEWVRSLALLGMTAQSSRCVQDNFGGRWQVFGYPICHAASGLAVKSGSDTNSAHTHVTAALGINLFVTYQK